MPVIYFILRIMVRLTLRIFYKEFTVHGRERIPRRGPLIVVANHPNTLMDPLIVASLCKQMVGFMGNGSLFRNKPLGKLLRFFNVIPVYRKQDIRPGENIDNQDNFEHARAFLAKGGTILIFPEGTSFAEKRLRELRTGAARIAMSFEDEQGHKGGLQVLPVALNYSAPTRTRSRIRIDVGTPIPVGPIAAAHGKGNFEAVRELTEAIRDQIADRLVILEDAEQELLHTQVTRLYREQFKEEEGLHHGHAAQIEEIKLADRIRQLKAAAPEVYANLRDRLGRWFSMLDQLRMREGFFRQRFQQWNVGLLWGLMLAFLVLTSPLFLVGAVTNYLPYWFPGWLAPRLTDEIEYHAPARMVMGMFLFPMWWGLLLFVGWLLGLSGWLLVAAGVALPFLGAFALLYAQEARRFRGLSALVHISGRRRSLLEQLQARRDDLIGDLNQLIRS
ncbi:MAG: lysophospholipid acyltransferase family protein [Bacteroidia bacterium]